MDPIHHGNDRWELQGPEQMVPEGPEERAPVAKCKSWSSGHFLAAAVSSPSPSQSSAWTRGKFLILKRVPWAIGIDMYTLMCIKLMTNKDLLYKKINKIKFKNSKINK